MNFRRGVQVVAVVRITEQDFAGKRVHVHAEAGDRGRVLSRGERPELVNVLFEKSGTITIVDVLELRPAKAQRAAA